MSEQTYDEQAAEFHADTGYLAPGKDASPVDCKNHDYDLRRLLWKTWLAGRRRASIPSLREMAPEQAWRLAGELDGMDLYGPWTDNGHGQWWRESISGDDSCCVIRVGDEWQWNFAEDERGYAPTARAAMQAADEQLRKAGAILCGGIPDDA